MTDAVAEPLSPLIKPLYDNVKSSKDKRTVVAIDIGVTETRYAYTTEKVFLKEAVSESLEITPWHQGQMLETKKVFKAPSSIVLNNEHQCVAFGIKAEDMIIKGKPTNEALYFHRFMSQLYTRIRESLSEATTNRQDQNPSVQGPNSFSTSDYVKTPIKDIYGKTADIVDILGAFLQTLVDKILEHIKSDPKNKTDPETIRWVFTYPDILNNAEMIIHKCAQKAGISYSNIYILPEVEAASLCCQNRLDSIYGIKEHVTTETKTFLVVFLGDFASYCVLHKTRPTGQIDIFDKEVEDFGDYNINGYFLEVLSEILQGNTLEVLRQEDPSMYADLLRNLEKCKKNFGEVDIKSSTPELLYVLQSYNDKFKAICGKDIGTLIQSSKYSGQIDANDNDFVLTHEFMESLYTKSLQKIESLILKLVGIASHIFLIGCLSENKFVQNYVRQRFHDIKVVVPEKAFWANLEGSVIYAAQQHEQWFRAKFGCPVRDCEGHQKNWSWMCMKEDCRSPLLISSWGNLECEKESPHGNSVCFWKFQCGLHEKEGADLTSLKDILLKSKIIYFKSGRVLNCLEEKLKAQRAYVRQNPVESKDELLAIERGSMEDEEKWINLKLGCPVESCRNKDGPIVWKCMTDGCTNPLCIGSKGNIKCLPQVSSIQHTCFITKLMLRCDFPDHTESMLLQLHELPNILRSLEKTADFDLSEINPLSKQLFIDSFKTAIQPHIKRKGNEFLEKKPNLVAIDEDMLVAEDWVKLISGCPAQNCYRSKTVMNWKCMTKEHEVCRSQLYVSNYGNLKCDSSNIEQPHTGALWHWEFYCDMHDKKMVDIEKAIDVLTNGKLMKELTQDKPTFLYTLKSKIRKEIQRQKDEQYKADETKKIAFLAMDEASAKEYPYCWGHQRDPPSLVKEDEISEEAVLTCDTVIIGMEHVASRLILKDGKICKSVLTSERENAKKMKHEISSAQAHLQKSTPAQVHVQRGTSAQFHVRTSNKQKWNQKGHYNMFDGMSQIGALYDAIDKGEYIKMLTIFYQSQHTHVLRYAAVRQDIGIILDTEIPDTWKEAITDSIAEINEATPGLYLFLTDDKEDVKIEITMSEDPDKCSTDIDAEVAKIFLGVNLPNEQMYGTVIHELLHALGFMHEMQRYDAHLHLLIDESKIEPQKDHYDTKFYAMLTRFDPFSVMMYPETEYLSRTGDDPIWELKSDKDQSPTMSELDKVALNLVYPPCITHLFNPQLNPTYQMLYCGRKVMSRPNQASESNTPSDSNCGPNRWSNCPACRVIKEIEIGEGEKTEKIEKIYTCIGMGKWQGMSGVFYCGKRHSKGWKAVCGPDEGLPCTNCGKMLYEDYSYEKLKKSGICTIL